MSIVRLICIAISMVMTTSALSAQFYIVQEPGTTRCVIAEQPPATGTGTVVGDGAYGDRAQAEADLKSIAACADTPR